MAAEIPDATKLQEEFLNNVSQSLSRIGHAWEQTMQASGLETLLSKISPGWPSRALNVWDSVSIARKLEEVVNMAAKDLPSLLEHQEDGKKIEAIVHKWTRAYQGFVRDICRMPARSDAERIAEQWGAFLRSYSIPISGPESDSFASFFGVPRAYTLPLRSGPGGDLFRMWRESSEKMIRTLFPSAGSVSSREAGDQVKSAVDAQMRFLSDLIGFQDRMVESSTKVVERIVNSMTGLKIVEITPETYKVFYETWLAQTEQSFSELLKSEVLVRTLSDAVKAGMEAREKVERIISDWIAFMNVPQGSDLEEVRKNVRAMQDKITDLERQLDELRRKQQELPCKL